MIYQLMAKYGKKNSVAASFNFLKIWTSKKKFNKALFPETKNSSGRKGIYNSLNFEGRNVNGSRPLDLDA